jgi:tRNA U34 5-methylaminomethyl-2-thiouridine-forming methyltransferase MnmC
MCSNNTHKMLITTEDGSHSVYTEQFNATYHSKHGAIRETLHVFIEAALKPVLNQNPTEIRILEMGFGTGLNAWMTFLETRHREITLFYDTIEAFPISTKIADQLNYPQLTGATDLENIFFKMHDCPANQSILLSDVNPRFVFKKYLQTLESLDFEPITNIIYYDAFAPQAQPHLWEYAILNKMFQALASGGVLVTYCAQGAFKRTLKQIGFKVEGIPGPAGKREMTRAFKP